MFRKIFEKLCLIRNPIAYWRKKGAQIGDYCEIYSGVNLGSEPYLVKIGNHVRISANTKITTHDGGLWVLRWLHEELKDVDEIIVVPSLFIFTSLPDDINC